MYDLLNDSKTYCYIRKDITKSIEKKLKKAIYELYKNDRISQYEYYYSRSTDAIAPRIYGLPKIHKLNCPLRPIVSFINSPLYNLSKFYAKIMEPLVNQNNLSLKNSFEFVEKIANLNISNDDFMGSFDVVSLFTKVPVELAEKSGVGFIV